MPVQIGLAILSYHLMYEKKKKRNENIATKKNFVCLCLFQENFGGISVTHENYHIFT